MELQGTGYMVQVIIDSYRGTPMKDLDFTLEFYVNANRRETLRKSDLLRIEMEEDAVFVAMLDSRRLGKGTLWCNVHIADPENRFPGGSRPVKFKCHTGKFIGECNQHAYPTMHDWCEGYKASFNFLWKLPKPEVAYIFYGKFMDQISSFDELTPEMLVSPENKIVSVAAGKMGKTPISDIVAGNKVLVLVPSDYGYVATKDNGIGGKVPFDTSIMGCNGEKQISVDGSTYNIYGEFMTVSGELFIYVD